MKVGKNFSSTHIYDLRYTLLHGKSLKQELYNTHNKPINMEISLSVQSFYTNKSFIIDKCTSEVTIVIKINALIYIFNCLIMIRKKVRA